MKEPLKLRRGKAFHRKIKTDWINNAEGNVTVERVVAKLSGRKGRVDVLVDQDQPMVGMIEVKGSDCDAMTGAAGEIWIFNLRISTLHWFIVVRSPIKQRILPSPFLSKDYRIDHLKQMVIFHGCYCVSISYLMTLSTSESP